MGRVNSIGSKILSTVDGKETELEIQDGLLTELAYAITVHKAQGSQWQRVIVTVFSNRLMDRSLIYTALTRAQEQVLFWGQFRCSKGCCFAPCEFSYASHWFSCLVRYVQQLSV